MWADAAFQKPKTAQRLQTVPFGVRQAPLEPEHGTGADPCHCHPPTCGLYEGCAPTVPFKMCDHSSGISTAKIDQID